MFLHGGVRLPGAERTIVLKLYDESLKSDAARIRFQLLPYLRKVIFYGFF